MPTYEYACDACHKTFELEQRITEDPVKKCANCGEMKARRMISGGTFMLKGSGWYADGYSGKSNAKADTGGDGAAKGESANNGATKPETKSEAKSEVKAEPKIAASSAD